jgi:hypothetical protein
MVVNNDIPSTIPTIPRFAGNIPNLPITKKVNEKKVKYIEG